MTCPHCHETFPVRSLWIDHMHREHEQETT